MTFLNAGPADYHAAWLAAKDGDVIALAPGAYMHPQFVTRTFATPVRVTAADLTQPPVFHGINVGNCAGVEFSYIEVSAQDCVDPYYSFRMGGMTGVAFRNMEFHGDPAKSVVDQVNGVYIANSTNVVFDACEFHDLDSAIMVTRMNGFKATNSRVWRVDKGAIHFAQSSDVWIEGNRFFDFAAGPATHADVVQGFTSGTTASSQRITIKRNAFVRRNGTPPQGILIQDELKLYPTLDVTIEDNLFLGAQWNSIVLEHAGGNISITRNVVASWPGVGPDLVTVLPYVGGIRVSNPAPGAGISVLGNQSQTYILPGVTGVPAGNTSLGPCMDGGAAEAIEWALQHIGGERCGLHA